MALPGAISRLLLVKTKLNTHGYQDNRNRIRTIPQRKPTAN